MFTARGEVRRFDGQAIQAPQRKAFSTAREPAQLRKMLIRMQRAMLHRERLAGPQLPKQIEDGPAY